MGLESFYMQHSGRAEIDPTQVSIIDSPYFQSYASHLLNMEVGFLVNRFRVSYRWVNILGDAIQSSSRTYPMQPIRQLMVVWQFWN